jgi:hypothetical protein
MGATNDVNTVVPVVSTAKPKQFDETDILIYLPKGVEDLTNLGYGLQTSYDNPSEFQRDFVHDGVVMALKYLCQQTIQRWDNTVTRASKQRKYAKLGREAIVVELVKRSEFRKMFDKVQVAIKLKSQLS